MRSIIELSDNEKSEVKEIWRMYKRGKWYQSDTAMYGYEKYYYATKVRIRLYYKDRSSAERDAEKYNKRREAYEKGRIPKYIDYDMFEGTELKNDQIWWHNSGSWIYEHRFWDGAYIEELLDDDMFYTYDDYNHTTADFFDVLTKLPRFSNFELAKNSYGEYVLKKRG